MKKFAHISEKYQQMGVRADNIEYAIESVKLGAKRAHILENLNADYRGMSFTHAQALLNELFAANGGEFKKENRGGYLYGILFLLLGLACGYYLYYVFTYGGTLIRPIWIIIGAVCCTFVGLVFIIQALRGKYRDADDPFRD